jgi:GlcNAc-P-P-Und epimerase
MTAPAPRDVVIFGGAGFIGGHLTNALSPGATTITLVDLETPRPLQRGVVFHRHDVRRRIELEVERPPDLVINLAAVHRSPGHRTDEYYDTNVRGALEVTDWCERVGAMNLLFTSSIAVYGPSASPLTETSTCAPDTPYGHSKLLAERAHELWAERDPGRRLVIVRPAPIFGTGSKGNVTRLAGALRKRRFVYPGRTDTVKSLGYVKDLVDAIGFILEHGPGGVSTYNFAYPDEYSIQEVCETFGRVAGFARPVRITEAAFKPLALTASADWEPDFFVQVRKARMSSNVRPERLVTLGYRWPSDLESALAEWSRESDGTFV